MSELIGSIFSVNENGEETVKIEHVLRMLGNAGSSGVVKDNTNQLLAALQIPGEFFTFSSGIKSAWIFLRGLFLDLFTGSYS